MKKIISILLIFTLITGCGEKLNNKPTKQVEKFFMNYQTLSKDVIEDLNNTLAREDKMTDEQKEKYKKIIKNHYKNLTYEIKDEEINGNQATVKVEVEVYDYSKIKKNIEEYYKENQKEFLDENNNIDQKKYIDYKLEELSKAKEKIKYTIDMKLTKVNDEWKLNSLSDIDEEKILGIY